ncbi:MAG: AMP-binding protein, partial [Chloroflexi bacterium]|nr:AMP-binding protein [Chloroflexota bacterium]
RLTFEQTWRRAHEFAAGLIALGLQKGDRAALVCENGLEWAIAYYAISIAGGVGVPLYTELKRGEMEEQVRSSGARIVLASTRVLERIGGQPTGADAVIVVGGSEARPGQAPGFLRRGRADLLPFDHVAALATDESRAELARRRVLPDDLASLVFTSGTTGGMKGVMLTHKNFMSNVESARRSLQFDEKDRIVLVLPMHHAFPFIVALISSAAGGEVTFENDLLRVRDRLAETKPTIFLGVPALFEQMYRTVVRRAETEGRLEMFERGLRVVDVAKRRTGVNLGRLVFREVHQQLGGHLRFVLSGGAALKPEVARQFFRLGLPLLQGWGLTEAAPVVAVQRWVPRKFFFSNYYEERAGSVGQAIDGVEVKLIDVPEKEIYVHLHGEGELVVRGPNVFAGYWQAKEETRAAKAGGWLRTGDLGRIDEEGNIWITGRSKYVIVLDSGEKVVPDELEERFGLSELIQDICIVPHRSRNKTLIGAIVYPNAEETLKRLRQRGEQATEETVRKLVQEELDGVARELAPYKRVSGVMLADTPLPKTAILKVMRGQLPETFSFDVTRWQERGSLAAPADGAASE